MKELGIIFLSFLFLLTFVFSAKAQSPVIYAPETLVYSGKPFSIPVKVNQFKHITGMQFIVPWDTTRVRYRGLRPLALALDESKNFGTSTVRQGLLRFLWFDETLQFATLADSTSLFAIEFEPVGFTKGKTTLRFAEDRLTKIEVYDHRYGIIDAAFLDGNIVIDETNATLNDEEGKLQAVPNPFTTHTTLDFTMEETTDVQIRVFDAQGRLVYEQARRFDKGRHVFQLDREVFSGQGAYICQVRSEAFNFSQKLIVL